MTTITTRKDQTETASAARKVGGYGELVRLASEQSKQGQGSTVKRDSATGRWSVFKKPAR
jgi:hypothetical protein